MSVLLTPAEFISDFYMGSSGTVPANAVQVAIDLAEGSISDALGFPVEDGAPTFLEASRTEEIKWPCPLGRPLRLRFPRITEITSVTALHDAGTCDCEWTELTACAFLYDARTGLVEFRECSWVGGCWRSCRCPHRVRVVYKAGFTAAEVDATTETGRRLRLAAALLARDIMSLLDFNTDGVAAITSWSSLGYSESRDLYRTTLGKKLGRGWLAEQAAGLLGPLKARRGVIMLRG